MAPPNDLPLYLVFVADLGNGRVFCCFDSMEVLTSEADGVAVPLSSGSSLPVAHGDNPFFETAQIFGIHLRDNNEAAIEQILSLIEIRQHVTVSIEVWIDYIMDAEPAFEDYNDVD